MPNEVTYPVQVLREHTTALEAALLVCLADSGQKPVHRLRTETRRVGAQILLLSTVSEAPEHGKQAARLLRALRKLRRAAGAVRDLDVHRKRLEELSGVADEQALASDQPQGMTTVQEAKEIRKKKARQSTPATDPEKSGDGLREIVFRLESESTEQLLQDGATKVREYLAPERKNAAGDLLKLLKKQQTKTAAAAEALLNTLEPALNLEMSIPELLQRAEAVFARDRLLAGEGVPTLSPKDLHTLRKAAKAARYLAETAPESPSAVGAAERFEALQQAGGQWHDAHELSRAVRHYLGKAHLLTAAIVAQRDIALGRYRQALTIETTPASGAEKRPKSAKKSSRRTLAAA